jgi:hypothetical protein
MPSLRLLELRNRWLRGESSALRAWYVAPVAIPVVDAITNKTPITAKKLLGIFFSMDRGSVTG